MVVPCFFPTNGRANPTLIQLGRWRWRRVAHTHFYPRSHTKYFSTFAFFIFSYVKARETSRDDRQGIARSWKKSFLENV